MRILVDLRHVRDERLSGVGTYTVELLRALFAAHPEDAYTLLTSGFGAPSPFVAALAREARDARHVHLRLPNKRLNLELLCGLGKTLDERAGGGFDLAFLPNLNVVRLSPGLPYVLTLHDLSWRLFPGLFSWKMRAWHAACRPNTLVRDASRVIVPSRATAEDVEGAFGLSAERIAVVPHGVSRRKDGAAGSEGRPFALFLGTLEPRKNIPYVVDAVRRVREMTGRDVRLVIAGATGWKAGRIEEALRVAEGEGWVTRRGYVTDAERTALYRGALALIWPSQYEGFGLPPLEAMAEGCPVITSAASSLPEATGGAAMLVDPFDANDAAQGLAALLADDALRTRLIQAGRARAAGFTWERAAEKTHAIFCG